MDERLTAIEELLKARPLPPTVLTPGLRARTLRASTGAHHERLDERRAWWLAGISLCLMALYVLTLQAVGEQILVVSRGLFQMSLSEETSAGVPRPNLPDGGDWGLVSEAAATRQQKARALSSRID